MNTLIHLLLTAPLAFAQPAATVREPQGRPAVAPACRADPRTGAFYVDEKIVDSIRGYTGRRNDVQALADRCSRATREGRCSSCLLFAAAPALATDQPSAGLL